MLTDSLVVLDFETTGLRPDQGDRITEVAAVRLHNGTVIARYESLINCERRLSNSIRSFTGINQQMIDSAPAPQRVLTDLLTFIGNDPVFSHNAAFDQGFLDCECDRLQLPRHRDDFICTVQLARHLLPDMPSHSLHALMRYFKLPSIGQHRAALDAEGTARVLLKLCALATDRIPANQLNVDALRQLAVGSAPEWHSASSNTATLIALHSA